MLKIINPANGQLINEIVEDSTDTITEKYRLARQSQPAWAGLPLQSRIDIIENFGVLLVEQRERLAKTLTAEMGKPITQSRSEISGVLKRVEFFTAQIERIIHPKTVHTAPGVEEIVSHPPLGVIANISAWNYPYFVASNVFLPALLTGNSVLYKPSEYATLSGLEIEHLFIQAGLPAGVLSSVVGGGSVGTQLLKQKIDGLFFTGSYATGLSIAKAAADKLIPLQLELGGKDPAYVCDDANVENAAQSIADGTFYNCGQSCCSVERIYVHEAVYERFIDIFITSVNSFNCGDPMDEQTYIGPLAQRSQLTKLEKQIDDATKRGAHTVCGGRRQGGVGNYFLPTVLTDVDSSMDVMREESFGPVIGIQKVGGDNEAIQQMNDSPYGLTAGVYSENRKRAKSILAQLNSGSVYWNCCDRVSPHLPWSGRKNSGLGTTLGSEGIRAFTRPKAWHFIDP